jgi:hypothetical protein
MGQSIQIKGYPNTKISIKLPKVITPQGLIIHFSENKQINYKPNIKIPKNKFAEKIIEALDSIYKTLEGKIVLNELINSTNKYHIYETQSLVSGNKKAQFSLGKNCEFDKPFEKLILNKDYISAEKMLSSIDNLFIGAFIGYYVTAWDNHNYDGVKMNLTLAMGHEIFHAYQFELGQCNGSFIGGLIDKVDNVILLEAQAVGFENYLRGHLYSDTKYGKTRASYSHLIDSYMEKPDWWDYLIGFDKLDVKEFKEGGVGYRIWKDDFKKMIDDKWKSITK